jgi:propanol-preferring alcohol dehydrogenase
MGHKTAGYVDRVGSHVTGYKLGDAILVSVIWGCGQCRACTVGRDNVCATNGSRTRFPTTPGIGPDGGMAEYMRVKARHVEMIGDLDPASAAPLADAGVTPMHAINNVRDRLTPDATAVVIGVGWVGSYGNSNPRGHGRIAGHRG